MMDLYNVVVKGGVIPGWKKQEVINNLDAIFKTTPRPKTWGRAAVTCCNKG